MLDSKMTIFYTFRSISRINEVIHGNALNNYFKHKLCTLSTRFRYFINYN